jgi:DNA uptake protein ComE-like DNA-binding protein
MIEQRAQEAERRAAFAEKLALLKIEESEREQRLSEVISGIERAEERAREAEQRAEAAERAATSALDPASAHVAPEQTSTPSPAPPPVEAPIGSAPVTGPVSEAPAEPDPGPVDAAAPAGTLNLNTASFEQLREAELSVTQATRILAYRERFGGYRSVSDLEKVPGFPPELVTRLAGRLTV